MSDSTISSYETAREAIRRAEFESVSPWFQPGMNVLEIGGADGLQASLIAAKGCSVTAIDIADRPTPAKQFYPVETYGGARLPYETGAFDVVFSSNVLEHISSLNGILLETRRVLKESGLAIHIMPSASWRFWTSLTHYPNLVRSLAGRLLNRTRAATAATSSHSEAAAPGSSGIWRRLFPSAHGEYPSALAELYYYRRKRWKAVLQDYGFVPIETISNRIFYTGHVICPSLSLGARRRLSKWLGSSCSCYILKKGPAR